MATIKHDDRLTGGSRFNALVSSRTSGAAMLAHRKTQMHSWACFPSTLHRDWVPLELASKQEAVSILSTLIPEFRSMTIGSRLDGGGFSLGALNSPLDSCGVNGLAKGREVHTSGMLAAMGAQGITNDAVALAGGNLPITRTSYYKLVLGCSDTQLFYAPVIPVVSSLNFSVGQFEMWMVHMGTETNPGTIPAYLQGAPGSTHVSAVNWSANNDLTATAQQPFIMRVPVEVEVNL